MRRVAKGKRLRSSRKASKRIYDTATMVALKGRGPEREPAIRSVLRAVILIVLGDVSEQRVACLLCRCKIIHLVGLRRSLVSFYKPSPRPMPSKLPPLDYSGHFEVRYVSFNGGIRWKRDWVNVSIVCAGEYVRRRGA